MCTTTVSASDRRFMRRAIVLARTVAEHVVRPNPRVGALIVESGHIVAEGFHAYDGGPHAERVARKSWSLAGTGRSHVCDPKTCSTIGHAGSCWTASSTARKFVRGRAAEIPIGACGARFGCCASMASRWFVVLSGRLQALNTSFNRQMRALGGADHSAPTEITKCFLSLILLE